LLHSENLFYQRANFLLVAESLVLVAYSAVENVSSLRARAIALFGVVSTVAWFYISIRSKRYNHYLMRKMQEIDPTYEQLEDERPAKGPGTMSVLTFLMPGLSLVVWCVLLFG
jgi:hypothetical protein